jgi:hypothetical protein
MRSKVSGFHGICWIKVWRLWGIWNFGFRHSAWASFCEGGPRFEGCPRHRFTIQLKHTYWCHVVTQAILTVLCSISWYYVLESRSAPLKASYVEKLFTGFTKRIEPAYGKWCKRAFVSLVVQYIKPKKKIYINATIYSVMSPCTHKGMKV